MRTWSAGCKRWAILQKTGLQFTPWTKRWSRRTLTAYSHYTQHQFFPPSAGVAVTPCIMVLQRMQCNWALIMRRPASQLYVGIAALDVATRRTCSAGCKRCNALVKVHRKMWPTVWMMRFWNFLIRLLTTFGALSSVRDGSQSAVGGCMWESENIYPSIVGKTAFL